MEDQSSLRGQGFTLLVFGGLVALCSVFFILGMIVGRGQAVPGDPPDEEATVSSGDEEEPPSELGFYDNVINDEFPVPEIPPAPAAAAEDSEPEPELPASLPDTEVVGIMLQVGAFGVEQTANEVVAGLRGKGFPGIVLRPVPEQGSTLHRVQVGPFATEDEASRVRSELLDAGYEVMIVR